jgi:hypothetical protein
MHWTKVCFWHMIAENSIQPASAMPGSAVRCKSIKYEGKGF